MLIPIDEVVHFDVITRGAGGVSDADSTPTFDVFEEATDTPILDDQSFTKRTSLTGNYRGTFTASSANGFEEGKWYNVIASATVGGVADKAVALTFRIAPVENVAGVPKVDVTHAAGTAWGSGAITAGAIATGAIDADALAADAVDEIWDEAMTELSAVPGVTASLRDALRWLFLLARNKITQTSTTQLLRNDADNATVGTSTLSDDGTTFIRGEFS